eukprot:TRINITY_DN8030_c0_g1_i2.p1 TRINITY_DN8030_c0_g1~~TRINITY_DN8030_c0_g1_i2.p1  ORF type:complete len:240 (-),score=59.02 TRINITY_DN8030_c0_g1_i2:90-737(-)
MSDESNSYQSNEPLKGSGHFESIPIEGEENQPTFKSTPPPLRTSSGYGTIPTQTEVAIPSATLQPRIENQPPANSIYSPFTSESVLFHGERPKTKLGLDLGVECVIAYFFVLISSFIILILESSPSEIPSPPQVQFYSKFHCCQSILIGTLLVVGMIIFGVLDDYYTHGALGAIWWVLFMFVWITCMIQSYRYAGLLQLFKLPLIGDLAEKFAQK